MIDVVVTFDEDFAGQKYDQLKKDVKNNTSKPDKPTYSQLLDKIDQTILLLKKNPTKGNLIPRMYLNKKTFDMYQTNKIFRIELIGYWRLLYTIIGHPDHKEVMVLDFMDHDKYNKIFNYRKR